MAGPWEKYAQPEQEAGPWAKYPQPAAQPAAQPAEDAYSPVEGMSAVDRFMAGMGRSVAETGRGLRQAGTEAANRSARIAAVGLSRLGAEDQARAVAGGLGIPLADSLAEQEALAAENRRLDAPLMDTGAGMVGNIAGATLQAAIPAGGASARLAGVAGRLAPYAGAAARGAAYAGTQPLAEDENRAVNAAVGGAAGAAGQGVASGLARVAAGSREAIASPLRRSIEIAKRAGIPLHLSQVSQSIPAKAMASMAQYLPFSGAGRAAARQQEAFNRAVGETFGVKGAGQLTDDVMQGARRNLSGQFEDIYSRNNVPLGESGLRRLSDVERGAASRLTEAESTVVRKQMDSILAELDDMGVLTGQKYQALRSQIMKAEGPDKVGQAVRELRGTLDDLAAKAVGPEDAARLRQLRGQWANFRTAEGLLKQVAGAGGDVKPSAIWPAIRKGSTKEMRELGRLGQMVLKNPVPDSGTPGRLISLGLLGGGGATGGLGAIPSLAGLVLGGATLGRTLNSPLAASALLASQPARAAATSGLARLAQAAPYALPAAAHASTQPMEINVVGGRAGPSVSEEELEALRAQMGRSP